MKKISLLLIILLYSLFSPAFLAAQTVARHPYGAAVPRLYDITTYGLGSAIGSYYLDFPTLSANDTIAGLTTAQTLTNKTLTSPTVSSPTVTSGVFHDPNIVDTAIFSREGKTYLYTYQADALADDGTVTLPDATSGVCLVSCNAEAGFWLIEANGAVVKISGSTNTAAADTDANLCVYDGGTYGIAKNRLGATGEIRIVYFYN